MVKNSQPAILCEGAIPEEMQSSFLGAFIAKHTFIAFQIHCFPFEQISSVDSVMKQQPEEDFMFDPTSTFPKPFEQK